MSQIITLVVLLSLVTAHPFSRCIKRGFVALFAIIFCLPAGVAMAQPRTQVGINQNWNFTKSDFKPGSSSNPDVKWEAINLPHTWNKDDVNDDAPGYYRAACWYTTEFTLTAAQKLKNVYLFFNGANQQTTVYVNGQIAGTHTGGYTRFCIRIDPYLHSNQRAKNQIAIKVDNSYNDNIPPLTADFTFYGGIYRGVSLLTTNRTHFDLTEASTGVYVTTPQVSAARAVVNVRSDLVMDGKTAGKLKVVSTIYDAGMKPVGVNSTIVAQPATMHTSILQVMPAIMHPHLWSVTTPYLYKVVTKVYLARSNELLDEVSNQVGFRWFKFDADSGFYLNGKPLKLIGASRHQDYEGLGNALPESYHEADMRRLKAMGGNIIRIAHYPQAPEVLDACDRLGILASVEIPVVNSITETSLFYQNCKQMQHEMIRQNYNHPAVIIWGYMNEILLRPQFSNDKPRQLQYFAHVKQLAHQLDSITRHEDASRYTMMANHGNYSVYEQAGLIDIPMLVGWNLYSGWYGGKTSDFGGFMDKFHTDHPQIPAMVTEFGADADPRIRALKPVKFDKSVEYAVSFHDTYLKAIRQRPFISAAMIWNLADFSSESREESMPHINNKGLLTFARRPKDTYFFYQANLLRDPFIKISGWDYRTGVADSTGDNSCTQRLTVYSNGNWVTLKVNNHALPASKTIDGMANFDVRFKDGNNRVEAITQASNLRYTDIADIHFKVLPVNFQAGTFRQLNVMLGSQRFYIDPADHTVWMPDQPYKKGQFGFFGGRPYKAGNPRLPYGTDRNILHTDNDPIYQTQQVGLKGYHIDAPAGEYELTLYFAELVSDDKKEGLVYNLDNTTSKETVRDRVFDVTINGDTLLKNFNIAARYGYLTAGSQKFSIKVANQGGTDLQFRASKGEAVLNALQLKKVN